MRILYLDIETAPMVAYLWSLRPEYTPIERIVESGHTLCWAAKWEGKKQIMFDSVRSGRETMIKRVRGLIDGADAIVHYNGTKFDIPILNKEFLLYGLHPPSHFAEIDLLKTIRKRFRFHSNKLDYVCQELGIGGKVQHKGMSLWKECMAGDDKAWRKMAQYNRQDVRLLPELYRRIRPWITNHPNWALFLNSERPTCRNCGSTLVVKAGLQRNATLSYQRWRCTSCGTPLRSRTRIDSSPPGTLV